MLQSLAPQEPLCSAAAAVAVAGNWTVHRRKMRASPELYGNPTSGLEPLLRDDDEEEDPLQELRFECWWLYEPPEENPMLE